MTLSWCAAPSTPADAMAPSSSHGIIYQTLIQSNCQTFLGAGADVDVVSQVNARGDRWQVHVLTTSGDGRRAAVLSAASGSLRRALEELHRKSALAVDRFVAGRALDAVPGPDRAERPRGGRMRHAPSLCAWAAGPSDSDPDAASDTSDGSSSEGEDEEGEEDAAEGRRGEGRDREGREVREMYWSTRARPNNRPPPHGASPLYDLGGTREPPGPGAKVPPPRRRGSAQLPAKPAAVAPWLADGKAADAARAHPASTPAHRAGPKPPLRPPPPLPPPPPPPPTATAGPRPRSVILTVDWQGHGEATFVDECEVSAGAVRAKVRALLSRQHGEFRDVAPHEGSPQWLGRCEVRLRRVRVGDCVFVVAGARDALPMLLLAAGGGAAATPQVLHIFVDVVGHHRHGSPILDL